MKLSQKLALCWRILREKPGNLMAHAERELLPEVDDEMQALMNQGLRELVLVFSTHGHSGFSAGYAVRSLEKLLMFQPLRPLTGEPEEWGETFDGRCVQNRRHSSVFKGDPERFGGAAYDIDAALPAGVPVGQPQPSLPFETCEDCKHLIGRGTFRWNCRRLGGSCWVQRNKGQCGPSAVFFEPLDLPPACTVEANGGARCAVECCYPVTCGATPGAKEPTP